MASFQNKTRDEIPSANLIAQLTPSRKGDFLPTSGCETWKCAFAPDESYFAWSCGNRLVTLVPWNRCKSTLCQILTGLKLPKPGSRATVDSTDDEGRQLVQKPLTIDTGNLVRCVTFGSSTSDSSHLSSAAFWTRFSISKDLILATGHTNGRIRTWDIFTGKLILELMDHKDMVSDLKFSPTGSLFLVSTSCDGSLKVWDLKDDGNMFKTLKMHNRPVYSCSWSPDAGSLVSVGVSKAAFVWDMKSFSLRFKLEGHHHDIVACDYSPDGCLIATASWDTRVILWDSSSGKLLKTFGHLFPPPRLIYAAGDNGNWIRDLSFSQDGSHISTVADDGYLRFWDVMNEEDPVAVGTVEDALCCTYSPSGRVLAVGTRTGCVSFWQANMSVKPLLYLCRLSIRKQVDLGRVEKLFIPKRLVDYLLYKDWN